MSLLADFENGSKEQKRSVRRCALSAKRLVSASRHGREGLRAFSSEDDSPDQAATTLDDRLMRLLLLISTCDIDPSLSDQPVPKPNNTCRAIASKIAQDLYLAHRMKPIRVAGSIEGGIMLVYRDHPRLEMEIEVDNDGDVTGVISTDDEVLKSAMITLPTELSRLVTNYRLSAAPAMR